MMLDLFPEGTRQPATYVSVEFLPPITARTMALIISGRDTWGTLAPGEAALTVVLERNHDGQWAHVAGSAMAPGVRQDEDGNVTTEARLEVPVPHSVTPVPYYRVVLTCYAPCLCACAALFE